MSVSKLLESVSKLLTSKCKVTSQLYRMLTVHMFEGMHCYTAGLSFDTPLPLLACIGGTGTDNTSEFEDGQNIHLANGNMDQQQHRDLSPSCKHPVQQQPTDTANVEIFQLPGQHLHYMVSNCSLIDVLTTI